MSQLTRSELNRALETLQRWPREDALWVLELPPEERDIVCLLAGELGAIPVSENGEPPPNE